MINAAGKKQNAVMFFSNDAGKCARDAQTWCDVNAKNINVTDVRLSIAKSDYGTRELIAVLYNEV